MPSIRASLVVLLSFAMLLTGCQMSTKPRTVARYRPGDRPQVKQAKYWGEYRLYALGAAQRDPGRGDEPMTTVRLAAEDPFGFARDSGGRVVATAADQTFPIEPGSYAWQMTPDPKQPDTKRTGLLAVGTVVAVMVLIGVGSALAF